MEASHLKKGKKMIFARVPHLETSKADSYYYVEILQ